jgi:hypothetical protein
MNNLVKLKRKKFTKEVAKRKSIRFFKDIKYFFKQKNKKSSPIFILGSGRSGTTFLLNIFHNDLRVQSFGENNKKIASNFLLDLDALDGTIANAKSEAIVFKPILNSFDCLKLLSRYSNSKAVWLIRNYKDVIASSEKKFGSNTIKLMQDAINGNNKNTNWITRGIHKDSIEMIASLDCERLEKNDYLALVWWCVNRTIINDDLPNNKRFKLIKYEDLVTNYPQKIEEIYSHCGLNYLPRNIKVHSKSIGKGHQIKLSKKIDEMCTSLIEQIDYANRS